MADRDRSANGADDGFRWMDGCGAGRCTSTDSGTTEENERRPWGRHCGDEASHKLLSSFFYSCDVTVRIARTTDSDAAFDAGREVREGWNKRPGLNRMEEINMTKIWVTGLCVFPSPFLGVFSPLCRLSFGHCYWYTVESPSLRIRERDDGGSIKWSRMTSGNAP
ncbi:hypothetical protein C8F01DRAFT_1106112 [Mycena amicta]|nr:hypothetical protein C8F01DRAFT_1106112 [Mycena amicta]